MGSWIESANAKDCDFPLENLPYGVFSVGGDAPRCGVAIGDMALDLAALEAAGVIAAGGTAPVFSADSLNGFMALGPASWAKMRERLTDLLSANGDDVLRGNTQLRASALVPLADVTMHLPIAVSGYTDFYAGRQHAFNVGTMFRGPENAMPVNWFDVPIGYNGRASTIVVSGTPVVRPLGQMKPAGAENVQFGPTRRLDIELEMGAIVGQPSVMGQPITVTEAEEMIFGFVLLNDWSARDIQAWEYVPLGPFQGKAFATSISPWVVTKAALEPFRVSAPKREKPLLPYLAEPKPGVFDIKLEVLMQPEGGPASVISRTNARELYYSSAQHLTHHAIGGCKMNVGDLLGTGTISGPEKGSFGSLLELSWGGKEPIALGNGVTRTFIEDGDTLTLRGYAQGNGYRIGFGDCVGKILPAPQEGDWLAGVPAEQHEAGCGCGRHGA